MDKFVGSYTQQKAENIDAFLSSIGIGFMLRNLAKTQTPTIDFSADGDTITMKTTTTFKTETVSFKLGEEFPEKRVDGVVLQVTATLEDGVLVFHKKGDSPYTVTHTLTSDGMNIVYTHEGVSGTRYTKRD